MISVTIFTYIFAAIPLAPIAFYVVMLIRIYRISRFFALKNYQKDIIAGCIIVPLFLALISLAVGWFLSYLILSILSLFSGMLLYQILGDVEKYGYRHFKTKQS
jgi:hypothetical protein